MLIVRYENLLSSSFTWSKICMFLSGLRLYSGSYLVNYNSPHDLTDNLQQLNSTPVFPLLQISAVSQSVLSSIYLVSSRLFTLCPGHDLLDLSGSIVNVSFKQLCLHVVDSWRFSIL